MTTAVKIFETVPVAANCGVNTFTWNPRYLDHLKGAANGLTSIGTALRNFDSSSSYGMGYSVKDNQTTMPTDVAVVVEQLLEALIQLPIKKFGLSLLIS